jgi:hypothetical protein
MGTFVWGEGSSLKDRMIEEEMRKQNRQGS